MQSGRVGKGREQIARARGRDVGRACFKYQASLEEVGGR